MSDKNTVFTCEAEVAEGLEELAKNELQTHFGKRVRTPIILRGAVQFQFQGQLADLLALSLVQAIYLIQTFDVPRPKALLGDANFRMLLHQIGLVRALSKDYETFYISAAGSESSVMTRLKMALADQIKLKPGDEKGDLLIRVRPSENRSGWESLVRISPRPLATRSWRVCNLEGALNATVARAMNTLSSPASNDIYLNIGCGSGSLIIERAAQDGACQLVGCDYDTSALQCAEANIKAAGYQDKITLLKSDIRALPLPKECVNVITADLPFGQLVGSHKNNLRLYPAILHEAARVAQPDARFVLITHEIRLIENLLNTSTDWRTEKVLRVTLRGLHPRIFVLRKN